MQKKQRITLCQSPAFIYLDGPISRRRPQETVAPFLRQFGGSVRTPAVNGDHLVGCGVGSDGIERR